MKTLNVGLEMIKAFLKIAIHNRTNWSCHSHIMITMVEGQNIANDKMLLVHIIDEI